MLSPVERVERKLIKTDTCWLWTGYTDKDGYGTFSYRAATGATTLRVHRVMYEEFVGPIPDGLTIDHLCRVRNCCFHAHLEAVTTQVNTRRAADLIVNCPAGHAYDEKNTLVSNGKRKCRRCNSLRSSRKNRSVRGRPHK